MERYIQHVCIYIQWLCIMYECMCVCVCVSHCVCMMHFVCSPTPIHTHTHALPPSLSHTRTHTHTHTHTLAGLPRMFLCPRKTGGQAVAVVLPGLTCLLLLTSWPHLSTLLTPSPDSQLHLSTRHNRILLGLRDSGSQKLLNWNVRNFILYF